MSRALNLGRAVLCVVLAMAMPAHAATQTFADLLAQAKEQAAAGHKWAPPGDNMTETIISMMDMVPSATPEQLAELSELLRDDKQSLPPSQPGAQSATLEAPPPAASALVPVPPLPPSAAPARPPPSGPSQSGPVKAAPGPQKAPPAPNPLPGTRAALLFARGLDAEHRGDLSEARRFYASAATQGDAVAARNLGRLYDPAYLQQIAVGGVDPDPALARRWYERAVTLGDTEARPLLEALSAR